MDVDALMDPVILQRADHLETRAIANVSQSRITMAAEVSLEDSSILRAIEYRSPGFQLAHSSWRFFGVQLGHPPIVHVLPAAHRVGEMDPPVVAIVHVGQGRCDAALRHHGVGFAEQRLADEPYRHPGGGCLDCRPESRSACADDQHIMLVGLIGGHQRILRSDQTPIEQSRT